MTEQELRSSLHRAMNARLSGMQEDPWLAQRILNQPKGEKKMKRFTVQTVLAMILLLAIMGTVYAATLSSAPDDLIDNTPLPASGGTGEVDRWSIVEKVAQEAKDNHWMLPDYFAWQGIEMPDAMTTGFNQNFTIELDNFRFHLRDAFVNGNTVHGLIEITRTDVENSIILLFPNSSEEIEEKLLCTFYKGLIGIDQNTTLLEYVQEKNLPIYFAHSTFDQEGINRGGGNSWLEGEGECTVDYEYSEGITIEDGVAKLEWEVNYWDFSDQRWVSASMPIELPAAEVKAQTVDVFQTIEIDGIEVELQYIRLYENALDIEMEFVYRIVDPQTGDAEKLENMYFFPIDPQNWSIPNPGTLHPRPKELLDPEKAVYIMSGETYSKSAIQDGTVYLQMLPEKSGEQVKPDPDAPVIAVKLK